MAIVAGYFAADQQYTKWYSSAYNEYYINDVIVRRIRNGDSVSDVSRFFDKYTQLVSVEEREMIADVYSDSKIEKDDEFLHFHSGKSGALLQFRNGRLVNLNNNDYADYEYLAQINRYSVPNAWLRYGVLPFYVAFVLAGLSLRRLFSRVPTRHSAVVTN